MNQIVIFDLDDTLYKETDFLKSGFQAVASLINEKSHKLLCSSETMIAWSKEGKDVFGMLEHLFPDLITKQECLDTYRYHKPQIDLDEETISVLDYLKNKGLVIGLITDGREITQRNKIDALGLLDYINENNIVISESFGSEKPAEANYSYFMQLYPNAEYYYIGDNVTKDFVTPNRLSWQTFCLLDDNRNIHSQQVDVTKDHKAHYNIVTLSDLKQFF